MSCADVHLEVDLPVIDLSQFLQQPPPHNPDAIAQVRHACQEYGFFRVINHGIPLTLLQEVESVVQQLCAMPVEAKQRSATDDPKETYSRSPGLESFCLQKLLPHSDSVLQMSRKIWPQDGNPLFCKTMETYTQHLADLALTITKTIIASLDLDVERFYESDFRNYTSIMRINHYSCEGKAVEEEALFAHTDLGLFTILYTDKEGGLQIRSKEGRWLNVNPLSHSFVINIADCLKAWSNGRYRSAEHRVVQKAWEDRISLAYFLRFADEKEIWAPAELVDEEHPRRYRPFTFSQLFRDYHQSFDSKDDKTTFMDRYAALSIAS